MDDLKVWLALICSWWAAFAGIYAAAVLVRRQLAVKRWISTEAQINNIDLVNVSNIGKSSNAGSSIYVQYTYEYRGKTYTGDRVSVLDDVTFVSLNYDGALYSRMKRAMSSGSKIRIWMDPNEPDSSVVTRQVYNGRVILFSILALLGIASGYFFARFGEYWEIMTTLIIAVGLVWAIQKKERSRRGNYFHRKKVRP